MSKHSVEFAETDSALGVRYATLRRYADQRGCSTDELINLAVADFMGYRPPEDEEDEEWERAYRRAGFPEPEPRPLTGLKQLRLLLEEDDSEPSAD